MYRPFQGTAWEVKKVARTDRKLRLKSTEDILMEAAEVAMGFQDAVGQQGLLIIQELTHYLLSHRVLYVATPLAQRLMETRIEVETEHIYIPYHLFEICFDDSFEIVDGVKAPSTLVMFKADEALVSCFKSFLMKILNRIQEKANFIRAQQDLPPLVSLPTTHVAEGVQNTFNMRFRAPDGVGVCHQAINLEKAKGRLIDDVINDLGRLDGTVDLTEQEWEISRRMARIVLGAMCYLGVSEPDVRKFKDPNRPKLGASAPESILLGGSFKASPGWHLREAHWRFLKHERFKRDEEGKVRHVWVHGAEVNKEGKPAAPEAKVTKVEDEGDEAERRTPD